MKRLLRLLPVALILTRTNAETPAEPPERIIEKACIADDASALAKVNASLDESLRADPRSPSLLYTRGFSEYAAGSIQTGRDPANARKHLETAVSLLERIKGMPWEAESDALEGGILGELIDLEGGLAGMRLGPKSGRLLDQAREKAPKNPRVLLFSGISLISTPKMFGGDIAAGEKMLRRSVELFASAHSDAEGPHWGRVMSLAWLGLAEQKEGNPSEAEAAWKQALEIEPGYRWVKNRLLPSPAKRPAAESSPVPEAPIVADYYPPAGSAKQIGLLYLGGSEGGKPNPGEPQALSEKGYPVLTVAYFKAEGLPSTLERIPLEYLNRAVSVLQQKPGLYLDGVVVIGGSKGAELALVLAASNPTIKGVIAISPSSVVWQGLPKQFWPPHPLSSWTLRGTPMPFVPYDYSQGFDSSDPRAIYKLYERSLASKDAPAGATIPVENIRGPILLLSGDDDALWPSNQMAERICARLKAQGFKYKYSHVNYPQAGHTLNEFFPYGGTPEGNQKARIDSRLRILAFLDDIR
jgi:dienelactone hydrolase